MDLNELREALQLTDDVSDDDVIQKAVNFIGKHKPNPYAELEKLAETNPAIREMLNEKKMSDRKLVENEITLRANEVSNRINSLSHNGKFGLPVDASKKLHEAMIKSPVHLSDVVYDFAQSLMKTGLVPLGETGYVHRDRGAKTATGAFDGAVAKFMSEHKGISYADACTEITKKHPDLWTEYQEELFRAPARKG